jgi:hypothetical protein
VQDLADRRQAHQEQERQQQLQRDRAQQLLHQQLRAFITLHYMLSSLLGRAPRQRQRQRRRLLLHRI